MMGCEAPIHWSEYTTHSIDGGVWEPAGCDLNLFKGAADVAALKEGWRAITN